MSRWAPVPEESKRGCLLCEQELPLPSQSSARATNTANHWAISITPPFFMDESIFPTTVSCSSHLQSPRLASFLRVLPIFPFFYPQFTADTCSIFFLHNWSTEQKPKWILCASVTRSSLPQLDILVLLQYMLPNFNWTYFFSYSHLY